MAKMRAISATAAALLLAAVSRAAAGGDLPFGQVGEDLRNSLNNTTRIPGKLPEIPRDVRERRNSEKIFVYEIEATNSFQYDLNETGEAIAKFIQGAGLGDQCVDLRILKYTGSLSNTYGVVLRTPIPETKYAELERAVCADHPGCSTRPQFKAFDVSNLSIVTFGFSPNAYRLPPDKIKTFQLAPGSVIPTFSNACQSGKIEDSAPAGEPKAREFLNTLGVDIKQAQGFSLVTEGAQVWDFAPINHDRDE